MNKRYPNVEQIAAALPEGSLARTLCECFVEVESAKAAEQAVRSVLEKRLAELRESKPEYKQP